MKSFVEYTLIVLGAYGVVYGINYLFFRLSPVHSFPSVLSLPMRSIIGLLGAFIGFIGIFFYFILDYHEAESFFLGNLFLYMPIILIVLLVLLIIVIFKFEKGAWMRHNPKHSRLFLPLENKKAINMGVSISMIDDIKYGRGVSFSWFDGYFIAAGRHRVTLEFNEVGVLKRRNMRKVVYTKEMEFNFQSGVVYVVETVIERQTFCITRDVMRSV